MKVLYTGSHTFYIVALNKKGSNGGYIIAPTHPRLFTTAYTTVIPSSLAKQGLLIRTASRKKPASQGFLIRTASRKKPKTLG